MVVRVVSTGDYRVGKRMVTLAVRAYKVYFIEGSEKGFQV
jgi:hypothetical protein